MELSMDVRTISNHGNRFYKHAVILEAPRPTKYKFAIDLKSRNRFEQIKNTG